MSQLSFGFEVPDGHVAPDAPRSKPRKKAAMPRVQPGDAAAVDRDAKVSGRTEAYTEADTDSESERMAKKLSTHPDYKVLRRLQPCLDYGPAAPGVVTRRVLVLDTETTGLDQRSEKIIELAMLAVDVDVATGLPVGQVEIYEDFEDPGKPISPAIVQITGIDSAMVQGHRLNDARVNEMVTRADLIVAHNAGFDRPFVEARLPVFVGKSWACSFAGIDWKAQGAGSAKLEFLAHESGWFYDAHRAQVDCHALLQVLAKPLPKSSQTGLACLMAAAQNTRYKLRAVGAPFESKDKLKGRGYRWDGEGRVWTTTLGSTEALQTEGAWLWEQVFGQRSARILIEALDSKVQFSARPGVVSEMQVGA
jgi:DNA polymerase-3 subunit epsilon